MKDQQRVKNRIIGVKHSGDVECGGMSRNDEFAETRLSNVQAAIECLSCKIDRAESLANDAAKMFEAVTTIGASDPPCPSTNRRPMSRLASVLYELNDRLDTALDSLQKLIDSSDL